MRPFKYPILAAAVLAASCSIQEENELVNLDNLAPVFTAEIESAKDGGTKVYTDETLKVLWHADDRISIFNKNTYNSEYRFNGATGDNSGSFSKVPDDSFVTANELSYVLAAYPYSAATSVSNSGVLSMPLPATQTYAEGSFGRGANAMVAATNDNLLMFKNLCGYLMFKLYGSGLSVSSLTLTANGGEALAGTALVTMTPGATPTFEIAADGALSSVTLECTAPVALGANESEYTEFWFALPPVTMAQGFTLSVLLSDGRTFQKVHSGSTTITRSNRSRMAPVQVKPTDPNTPPDNEIWYTSTDGIIVEPAYAKLFNAVIVSNTYENGRGVIRFDKDLTEIKANAMCGLRTLSSLVFPSTLTTLGSNCFGGCTNLASVVFPHNLKSIASYAFRDCEKLESLVIPNSVEIIESGFCHGCSSLKEIISKYSTPDLRCVIVNNVLVGFAPYGITSYSIPQNVTAIGRACFEGSKQLTNIELPNGLISIGNYAFAECSSIKSITIPDSVETIGPHGVFFGCHSLQEFVGKFSDNNGKILVCDKALVGFAPFNNTSCAIPEGVERIGQYLFRYCTNLTDVSFPNSLKIIHSDAFYCCYSLSSVDIPSGVTDLYSYVFWSCRSLTSIIIRAKTPPVASIYMFDGSTCPIYVPAESVEAYKSAQYWSEYADRIQAIPEEGNGEAENVEVNIPDNNVYEAVPSDFSFNVTADGSWTIEVEDIATSSAAMTRGASDFVSVSVTSGGSGVVGVDVHLSSNFALVERGARLLLRHKKKTHTITITQRPRIYETSGTTTIAVLNSGSLQAYINEAFASPNNVTHLRLVGTLNNNDINTIYNLSNLKYLDLRLASVPDDFSMQYCTTLEYIYLPDDMKVLPNKALYGCRALKYVYGQNVKTIKDNALYGCLAMTECYFPAVEEIGYGAFQICESLESLVFPKVKTITQGAFSGCDAVKTVSFDALEELESGILSYNAPLNIEVLNLPKLKTVGDNAFRGQTKLKTLELPSLKTLGKGVITGSSIEEINFPVIEVIPQGAFSGEMNLRRVYCEKVKTVGQNAFHSCERLKDVIMPHATTLDHYAFYGCTLGGELDFSSVVVIGDSCFEKSTGIGSSTPVFPLTTWIGERAFAECVNLVAIQIPLASHICSQAFRGCTKLSSVSKDNELPTVNLENYALSGCPCLHTLRFPALTILGTSCFDGSGLTTLAFGCLPWRKVNEYGLPLAPFEYWTFPINSEDAKRIHLIINDISLPPVVDEDHPWWKKEVDESISFLRHNWAGLSKYQ